MTSFETFLADTDLIAVVNRHIAVSVIDVSATGCLLESRCDLPVGTVCTLSIKADRTEYGDPIRVTRSQRVRGGGDRYFIGAEFVWLTLPDRRSIRRLVRMVAKRSDSGVSSMLEGSA
jgi:hypothetical protein